MSSTSQFNPYEGTINLLVRTRDIIKHRGWGQGNNYDFDPSTGKKCNFCLIGAMGEAELELESDQNSYYESLRRLFKICQTETLMRWNDSPGRTKEEVLAKLDEAISQLTL